MFCKTMNSTNTLQGKNVIKSIYNARTNIIFYLKSLGFDVSQYEKFAMSEINAMKQQSATNSQLMDFQVSKSNTETSAIETCQVIHYLNGNMKQSILENIVSEYYEDKQQDKQNHSLIVVTLNPMNDSVTKSVKLLWEKYNEYVSVLDLPSLQINILKHDFVPKHIKLTENEKKEFFKQYNVKHETQIPHISMFDPVAKIILLKPGDVCKIIRYNKISLTSEFYRICVI